MSSGGAYCCDYGVRPRTAGRTFAICHRLAAPGSGPTSSHARPRPRSTSYWQGCRRRLLSCSSSPAGASQRRRGQQPTLSHRSRASSLSSRKCARCSSSAWRPWQRTRRRCRRPRDISGSILCRLPQLGRCFSRYQLASSQDLACVDQHSQASGVAVPFWAEAAQNSA